MKITLPIRHRDLALNIILVALAIYCYSGIEKVFFQQDEWFGLAELVKNVQHRFNIYDFAQGHFVPLALGAFYIQYLFFGISNSGYGLVALLLHTLNALAFTRLCKLFIKETIPAFLTNILFATCYVGYLAVTWFATSTATLGSSLLFIGSLGIALRGYALQNKSRILLGGIVWVLSLLFKEDSLSAGIIFPFLLLFQVKRTNLVDKVKLVVRYYYPFVVYIVVRLLLYLRMQSGTAVTATFNGDTNANLSILISQVLARIFELVSQISMTFLPTQTIYIYIYKFFYQGILGTQLTFESVIVPTLITCITFWFLLYVVGIAVRSRRWTILLMLMALVASLMPYYFVYGSITPLSPRYLYIPSIFSSLLLGMLCTREYTSSKLRFLNVLLIAGLILFNIYLHKGTIQALRTKSEERFELVSQLNQTIDPKKSKHIYFLDGDSINYDPLQSSVGQIILLLLAVKNQQFVEFLPGRLLWDEKSGFYENTRRRFVYFEYKIDKLIDYLKDRNLPCSDVIFLEYDSISKKILSHKKHEKCII